MSIHEADAAVQAVTLMYDRHALTKVRKELAHELACQWEEGYNLPPYDLPPVFLTESYEQAMYTLLGQVLFDAESMEFLMRHIPTELVEEGHRRLSQQARLPEAS